MSARLLLAIMGGRRRSYGATATSEAGLSSVPYAPENIDGSGASGSFAVTWSPPTTNVDGSALTITSFNVRWGLNIGEQGVSGASQTAGRISSVAAGTFTKTVSISAGTYYVTVTALNASGESDTSYDFSVVVT